MAEDFFALFDIPRAFAVDTGGLEIRYRDIQSRVHPDKHAHLTEADRRVAMQWATLANEAYQTLKNPLLRARYLLRLVGHETQMENNTAMAPEFLIEQMEWRESVIESREAGDIAGLETLQARLRRQTKAQYATLQADLDEKHDYAAASDMVRQLMFQEKLLHEIDDAIEAIEA